MWVKETAVYVCTHGGVRGRGSNPPTYSIELETSEMLSGIKKEAVLMRQLPFFK